MAYTVYYNTPGTILTYTQMQAELAALASANSWTYIDCGDSAQGREIGGVVVNGASYTKTVLIDAAVHGIENKSALAAVDFLHYLAANPSVYSSTRFVVVPILNPDGYAASSRKNVNDTTDDDLEPWPRYVDINRNFSRFWAGGHSSTTPSADYYCGPVGDSEPEAQVLLALFTTYEPDLYIDLHTDLDQVMSGRPNYAPLKVAIDADMTTNEFTPYSWVMNYMDGTTVSAAESSGVDGYIVELGPGEIHYEVNRCICALKSFIESHDAVTFDSMNDFSEDQNCVSWMRFNSGYYSAEAGIDWLEKNDFACLAHVISTTIKAEGDQSVSTTAYPRLIDANLSSDFPFKYGSSNLELGITGRVYLTSVPASGSRIYLCTKYDTSSKRCFALVLGNNAGTFELRALVGTSNGTAYQEYLLCSIGSSPINSWLFYGFGYSGTDDSWYAAGYSDSGLLGSGSGTFSSSICLTEAPWAIGCFHANNVRSGVAVAVGYIDETVFFKEKLSPTKISDIWAQEYTANTSGVTGTLAATLTDSTSSSTGAVAISGASAQTLSDSTVLATGNAPIVGSLAQTLASATLSASTSSGLSGALVSTLADAASAATGTVAIVGSLATTLATATVVGAGTVAVSGSLASTLEDASLSSGSSSSAIGALASTLQSATVSASGVVPVSGSLSVTLATATASSTGNVAISGAVSSTLADATLSAYFGDSTPAQLSSTLASATMAATGEVSVMGALSAALQDAFASGAGTVDIDAECAAILADCSIVIAGSVAIVGGGSATLASATLSARAGANLVPDALPSRIVRVARENRIVRA